MIFNLSSVNHQFKIYCKIIIKQIKDKYIIKKFEKSNRPWGESYRWCIKKTIKYNKSEGYYWINEPDFT